MNDNDITISWQYVEQSDMDNATRCKVTTELTFNPEEVERILQRLMQGRYVGCSQKGLQEKLKNRARRVEIERVHYKGVVETFTGP